MRHGMDGASSVSSLGHDAGVVPNQHLAQPPPPPPPPPPTPGHKPLTLDATGLMSLHQTIEHVAQARANKTAVICADDELTYHSLDTLANRLALCLTGQGVGRGDLVVVALDRSVNLVVALLAVLKTGAAYVPVDVSYPALRIEQTMHNSRPKLVVCQESALKAFSQWESMTVNLDVALRREGDGCDTLSHSRHGTGNDAGEHIATNLTAVPGTEELAYVIFTSGSTGQPKGVEVSHGAVSNFLSSMKQEPGCNESDRLLAVTTVAFDIAVLELFLPLVCGATTVIAQTHEVRDPRALFTAVQRQSITMMQGTPTLWQMMLSLGWPKSTPPLLKILCGGEVLSRSMADKLLEHSGSVWNMYGPTEATVWASCWKVQRDRQILIGNPVAHSQFHVLGEDHAPLPIGSRGELYISGACLANGYRNAPLLTRSRFLRLPNHGGVLYRTGDLVNLVAQGKIEVLGRTDDQIKIRGHRVESSEVESVLTAHTDIEKAVVVCRDDRLIAYCVRNSTRHAAKDEAARVADWAGVWDHAYGLTGHDALDPDVNLNLAGWHSSYDGERISVHEMRDWQSSSVQRILSYQPRRVIEVGSGTGMMLFGIAAHCSYYYAIDASRQAVRFINEHLGRLPNVVCEHRDAHSLPSTMESTFDTVIVNSVVQYFPSIDYLVSFIGWATKVVGKGRIYLGDVRNLALLDVFHADITHLRTGASTTGEQFAFQTAKMKSKEQEMIVDPKFFANLPSMFRCISHVDIALRDGRCSNEMSRYRYDVTIHINQVEYIISPTREIDWQDEDVDTGSIDLELTGHCYPLRLNNIPNGRLRDAHERVGFIVDSRVDSGLEWMQPYVFKDIAKEAGYESTLLPSRSGNIWTFDVGFWRSGTIPDFRLCQPGSMNDDLSTYTNDLRVTRSSSEVALDSLLRPWVAERLPAYMIPSVFVELSELPLTLNGKIDRKALPTAVHAHKDHAVKPTTRLECEILAVWLNILGLDGIDLDDNFFQIGGDSMRVVLLQVELEKRLSRPVSPAVLYEHFTIRALAAHFALNEHATPSPPAATLRTHHDEEAIAIISMACRLPGSVSTPEEYWDVLSRGETVITDVPEGRWDADSIYDADPNARGRSYSLRGGFLSSIDAFDAAFFGISPREAHSLDPAQYLMLETCWEVLERAGYTNERLHGSQTGVFIGVSNLPAYQESSSKRLEDLDGYAGTGSSGATMSGRISYTLGLEGPSLTIDAACSSSMVTTHMACNALRQGECDIAISGGVSLVLSPALYVEFSRLRGMAPDGVCRAFAADSEGAVWSEGSAAVVLKRLSDAQRDEDLVLAVIRGSAVNHGGRSASLTTPSGPAQKKLIRTALRNSGLQPGDIDYIEAHGTGTRLGDPIEGAALAEVFDRRLNESLRREPLWVGSAKSNIGHTQATAGLAGVLKVVLAMQHEWLPQTLFATKPNPAIDWDSVPMELVQSGRPWVASTHRRRAGVSAFGIGGTNAHVVVEDLPQTPPLKPSCGGVKSQHSLPILLSARDHRALRGQAQKLRQFLRRSVLEGITMHLGDVAFSLATTRNHFRQRLTLTASSVEDLLTQLDQFVTSSPVTGISIGLGASAPSRANAASIAMLFTGQGSQALGMGKELAAQHPSFRAAVKEVAAQFTDLEQPLIDVIWADSSAHAEFLLKRTDYAQPAIFTLQVALYRLWTSWGVSAEVLLGHSIGELAAAHVAGVMDLPDSCHLVTARARLMQAARNDGGMLALDATVDEACAAIGMLKLQGQLCIAARNTPTQTVVSGDMPAVTVLHSHFITGNRKARLLAVSHAFHSHHMDGMLAEFRTIANGVRFAEPRRPVVSGMTGRLAHPGELSQAEYWVQQVRQAVRFSDGVRTLHEMGINTFVELGPQPVLCELGAVCLSNDGHGSPEQEWLPSLQADTLDRHTPTALAIQVSLTRLHARHQIIDWAAYFRSLSCAFRRIDLPTYAFQRQHATSKARSQTKNTAEKVDRAARSHDVARVIEQRLGQIAHTFTPAADTLNCALLAVSSEPDQNVEDTLILVQEAVASVMGFASPNAVDVDLALHSLGLDSLTATSLRNRLETLTGLIMPLSFVIGGMTTRSICQHLFSQVQDVDRDNSTWSATSTASESAIPASTANSSFETSPAGRKSAYALREVKDEATRAIHAGGPSSSNSLSSHKSRASATVEHRILCPFLEMFPPHAFTDRYTSSLSFFDGIPWCYRLINESPHETKLLPGTGKTITFLPRAFVPSSQQQDLYIGHTLSQHQTHQRDQAADDQNFARHSPAIRSMVSLFRASDDTHVADPSRHIERVATLYALGSGIAGHVGVLHGGLIATCLDESLSIALELNAELGKTNRVFAGDNATASLNVEYLAPVPVTEHAICVMVDIKAIEGPRTTLCAALLDSEGRRLAQATSEFVVL